jgi:O-antigen ligase/polysaccharide polymerase Wzy-like membrane protein
MRLAFARSGSGAPGWAVGRGATPAQVAAAVAASAVTGLTLAVTADWRAALGLLAVAAFVAMGLLRPALFLVVFLLVRPLLDGLNASLGAGLNVNGVAGLLAVGVALALAAARPRPSGAGAIRGFLAVLCVSAVAAAVAILVLGNDLFLARDLIREDVLAELARLGALLAVYYLAARCITTPSRVRALFAIIGLSAVIPGVWGIGQLIAGPAVSESSGLARVSGPFTSPNSFGAYLAVCALVLIFLPRGTLSPWARWPSLAITLVPLVQTYSRMGWVLFVLGLVVLGWRERWSLVVAGFLAAALLAITVPAVAERALPTGSDQPRGHAEKGYGSLDWRIENASDLLKKWSQSPLLGRGLRSTVYVNERRPAESSHDPRGGYKAHNMVVRVLVEGGLLLLGAYVVFFTVILRKLRRLRRAPWSLAGLARLIFVIWALVIVAGIAADDPLEATAMMFAVLALTGALEGAYAAWQDKKPSAPVPQAPAVRLGSKRPLPVHARSG